MPLTGRMDGPVYRLLRNGLLLVSVIVSAGCNGRRDSETASRPFDGQHVKVAFPAGAGFQQTLRPVLDEWTAQTGADGLLFPYVLKLADRLPAQLFGRSDGQLTPGEPAVVILPLTCLSELSADGLLLPIPRSRLSAEHLNWLDFLGGLRERAASMGGRPTAIPLSCPVLVCYYRADLLEKSGLSLPRTWEEYQHLQQTLDEWAPGMTTVEPWNVDWRATMYLARAVSYAAHPGNYSLFFDIISGQPLIETPGFLRALEESQHSLARMPADVKQYTPADCRREFLAGRAAMAITVEPGSFDGSFSFGPGWTPGPGRTPSPGRTDPGARSPVRDTSRTAARQTSIRVTVARLPGCIKVFNRTSGTWESPRDRLLNRPTLVFGGLVAGVVGTGEAIPAAWNLLETMTGDQLAKAFSPTTLSPCRMSQMTDTRTQIAAGLKGAEQQRTVAVVAESLRNPRLIVELPIVARERFRTALTAGLSRALDGSSGAAESLATVAAKWQALSKQMGNDQVVDSYRRALGLSPRRKPRLP